MLIFLKFNFEICDYFCVKYECLLNGDFFKKLRHYCFHKTFLFKAINYTLQIGRNAYRNKCLRI